MRVLPAALVISMAAHVGAYAWVRSRHEPPKLVVPQAPASAEPAEPAPEPTPMAVVLLDEPSVSVGPALGVSHATPQTGPRTSDLRPQIRIQSEIQHPRSEVRGPRSPLMTMRQPELKPSDGFVEHFLSKDRPGVDPDRLSNPKWVENATGEDVDAARAERIAKYDAARADELKRGADGNYHSHHGAFDATTAPDGTVQLKDRPSAELHVGCLFGGCPMNLDDWAMRKAGIDPYRAAKLQWLDKTRDERAEIGLAHRHAELAQSADIMRQNLAWMWQKTRDPAERKEALFELWDEVAETGDDDLVSGGVAARKYLVGFIRTRLPQGSAGAFTDSEIAELNARRKSHAMFAPYQ